MQLKLQKILLLLLVHGLTAILLVGGLADEDQKNGLRHVPVVLHVICFCEVGQNGDGSKSGTIGKMEQQIRGTFDAASRDFLWKSDESLSYKLHKNGQNFGARFEV